VTVSKRDDSAAHVLFMRRYYDGAAAPRINSV